MPSKVQIKGIREGLLITLSDGEWDNLHRALLDQLDQQAEFLKGARLALDVGNTILKAAELGQLHQEIADRELVLWALLSGSPKTEETARAYGLATEIAKPRQEGDEPVDTSLKDGEGALLVRRTLRSGFSLQHAGHVVVIGDVNPGAEIIATGDVVVWGRLKGVVHAGAQGDRDAIVCALDLSPTQLRISDQIALTPKRRGKPNPEVARLEDGKVVSETWEPKRERK